MAALGKSGARSRAEIVRLPTARALHVAGFLPSGRSLLIAFGLLAAAAAAYAGARSTSVFAVESVEVRGAPPRVAAEVRETLAPLVGTSLLALDGREVRRRVLALPEVAAVTYDRAFPHSLAVTVRLERQIAVVRRGSEAWILAASGRVLRPVGRGFRPRLPRLWVRRSTELAAGATLGDEREVSALRALRALAAAGFPVRARAVDAADGQLLLKLATGIQLRLGDEADLALKLAVAAKVVPHLNPPALGGPEYLDVGVPERPVAGRTLNSKVELYG